MINSEWIEKLRAAAAMCRSQDDDLDYKYWAAVAFDMLPKASGHITELEAKVAALQEIAEEERGRALWFVGDDPEHPENLEWAAEPNLIPERVRRLWINAARRQLAEEHPEAFV